MISAWNRIAATARKHRRRRECPEGLVVLSRPQFEFAALEGDHRFGLFWIKPVANVYAEGITDWCEELWNPQTCEAAPWTPDRITELTLRTTEGWTEVEA